jgi:hypothetical protein
MALSNEAIISLIGVIVNLPTVLLALLKLWMRRRQEGADERVNESGLGWNFISFSSQLSSPFWFPHLFSFCFQNLSFVKELRKVVSHEYLYTDELAQLEQVHGHETRRGDVDPTGVDDLPPQ